MLQVLISESKDLKVSMKEIKILETVLRNCEEWKHDACSLLQDTRCLLDMATNGEGISEGLISKIEHVLARIGSMENTSLSLTFDFVELAKLKDACSLLQWCKKAISFCFAIPTLEVKLFIPVTINFVCHVCDLSVNKVIYQLFIIELSFSFHF